MTMNGHHHAHSNGSNGHVVQLNGHDGPVASSSTAKLRPGSSIDRTEFVRLILQSLRDAGYGQAATALEAESGIDLEASEVTQFRLAVLSGDWEGVERHIWDVLTSEKEANAVRFLVAQQKFLELLEIGQTKRALSVLRNELAPLRYDPERLHLLSSLMMCTKDELYTRAEWDGANGDSRTALLVKLQQFIPPAVMIPQHRLERLLEQAQSLQRLMCMHHIVDRPTSLYIDHSCDRSLFPNANRGTLRQHRDEIWALAFSQNGRYLASGSKDSTAIIWDVSDPDRIANHQSLEGHIDGVACLAWSPDDSQLLTSAEDCIKLWNVATGNCLLTVTKHDDTIGALIWLPDGKRFVSGGMDAKMHFWNLDGRITFTWRTGSSRIVDAAITPDGTRLVAIGTAPELPSNVAGSENFQRAAILKYERRIHVFNIAERKLERECFQPKELTSISVSADSKFLLVNQAPNVRLREFLRQDFHNDRAQELCMYDIEDLRLVRRYVGQSQGNHVIRSCFGGALQNFIISGSEDSGVYVWHRDTAALIEVLSGHESGSVNAVSWNQGSSIAMFASGGDDRTIRIWRPDPILPGTLA